MFPLSHLFHHVKQFGFRHKKLYAISIVLFFFALYDGIISYITPLLMNQDGFSNTVIGLIMGSSSIAGAGFDFALSNLLKGAHYRRIYLAMFAISFFYPLLLWKAKTVWLFLVAMALWGLYYDLETFGNFDFVSHEQPKSEHAASFGVLSVFSTLGYLIAPMITGFVIGEFVGWKPFFFSWIFLSISLVLYTVLLVTKVNASHHEALRGTKIKLSTLATEMRLWKHIGSIIFPVLLLTVLLNVIDATFWTIGPILAESLPLLHPFNGLLLTVYTLPSLLSGWFVGRITRLIGKKKTAFLSFIGGAALLTLFPLLHNAILMLSTVFAASFLMSLGWPSMNGAYADYVSETASREKEIEGLQDFSANSGYVIGPIFAGFLADHVGNTWTFSVIGGLAAIIAFVLFLITPKSITIPRK